jgi:hypothetical protein
MVLQLWQARHQDDTNRRHIVVHQVNREPTAMTRVRGERQTLLFRCLTRDGELPSDT